ncbi:hypothetical protein [Nocardia tengchongensis]|uniref:hypothetical protein n=1 Tax=Nocardia tengchongensis TaxID=2055889 RepID=UPI00362376B8
MKRMAIGLVAMSGIALGVSLSPLAASAQAPDVATIADSPASGSSAFPTALLKSLMECLTTGSAKTTTPGTPGTPNATGCLVS